MNKFSLIFVFLALFAGFAGGYLFNQNKPEIVEQLALDEVRLAAYKQSLTGDYKFINPLLECEVAQSIGEKEYKPSRVRVEEYINNLKFEGKITNAAVYWRDLNNGPWFGVNEKDSFSPASLLKVPVMMAWFAKAQEDSGILEKEIVYEEKLVSTDSFFTPAKSVELGNTYKVSELLEYMIIYSDNNALFLLSQNIAQAEVANVYESLGLEPIDERTDEMSVKSYATLLRVLYNSSFLDRKYSEQALELLSRGVFKYGIRQSVPDQITVAQKFGERKLANGVKQLHDCGVVYHPKRPYLLCVMTQGNDYNVLSETISEISKLIYDDFTSH